MREKDYLTPSRGIKLKWKGIFDVEAVYKKIKYWLDYNGFGSNLEEEEYYEIVKGDSKTIGVKWYAEKKATGYFGYVLEINLYITGMREVQVNRNGVNLTMNSGNFEVRLIGYLVRDVAEKYKNKAMQSFYEKVVVKDRVDEHKGQMAGKLYELQDEIKRFLGMQ